MKYVHAAFNFVSVIFYSSTGFPAENTQWINFRESVSNCNLSKIEDMIKGGFDLNYVDANGWTALHWSNFNNQLEAKPFVATIELLIKNGINVNKTDKRGRTALLLLLSPGDD